MIWVDKQGDEWVVGDDGGEFARSISIEMALPYVRDLMYGPGTMASSSFDDDLFAAIARGLS